MILKETLQKIIQSQKEELFIESEMTERTLKNSVDINSSHAVIISGIRRCGKSILLKQIINNVGSYNYFNFEDVRAVNFEVSDLVRLDEVFKEENHKTENYFFDEVQNIGSWERFVRTILDKKKKVFISGSNASLLSKELGTKLTGRHIRYELFPFSYSEMLHFIGLKPGVDSFEKYFIDGGFPEYIKQGNTRIMQELFNDIITRDIIVRYSIRNSKTIKELAQYLLSNVGKNFSYNNLQKDFKLGSVNTV